VERVDRRAHDRRVLIRKAGGEFVGKGGLDRTVDSIDTDQERAVGRPERCYGRGDSGEHPLALDGRDGVRVAIEASWHDDHHALAADHRRCNTPGVLARLTRSGTRPRTVR
jgi:hypothetical protein